ncbi:MAG: hypothetical protein HW410_272, partial [Nitrosarchaeum sp.]|nr:hypothetical protein [Nitrosarchaeum sp.]
CSIKNKTQFKNLFNLKNKTKHIFQLITVMFIDNFMILEPWQKLAWQHMVLH